MVGLHAQFVSIHSELHVLYGGFSKINVNANSKFLLCYAMLQAIKTGGGKAIERDYQKPVTLIVDCITIATTATINYIAVTIYSGAIYNLSLVILSQL